MKKMIIALTLGFLLALGFLYNGGINTVQEKEPSIFTIFSLELSQEKEPSIFSSDLFY